MCDCDCERPEFFNRSMVKARKDHKCDECWLPIRKGETYFRSSGKWDGYFNTYATCLPCKVLWRSVEIEGDCVCFTQLMEHVHELDWSGSWWFQRKESAA